MVVSIMTHADGPAAPGHPPRVPDTLLEASGLLKEFGATRALDRVDLSVTAGEVVAVVGHNGSGKSTLVKVLAGTYTPDAGRLVLAENTDLHVIHQDLGLIGSLTALENLDLVRDHAGLGRLGPIRPRRETALARAILTDFGVEIPLDVPVDRLSPAQQTLIAIVRALEGWSDDTRHVLVLDEPTAALHGAEVDLLLGVVRRLASRGTGILYISHRLGEVVDLADRVVVLKDGVVVAQHRRGEFDQSRLVELISGRSITAAERSARTTGDTLMEIRDLSTARLAGVDLDIRSGEIVGIAGVIGSGAEDLLSAIFGSTNRSGEVRVAGRSCRATPAASIAAGVSYVPADRRGRAAITTWTARENVTLPRLGDLRTAWGWLRRGLERREAERWLTDVRVHPAGTAERRFDQFSGGNQQKIVIAKWLRLAPTVLLLDEPTQGVDAGAQADLHHLIGETARTGSAVVVFSTDAKELVQLCDRVVILDHGRIVDELPRHELTESSLVAAILREHSTPSEGSAR
jgi:ABC-type sugar transport system ATPase subunit